MWNCVGWLSRTLDADDRARQRRKSLRVRRVRGVPSSISSGSWCAGGPGLWMKLPPWIAVVTVAIPCGWTTSFALGTVSRRTVEERRSLRGKAHCRFSAGRDPGFSKPFPPDLSTRA
jgi:hypothetical protein